jgi:D-tyrosyl-tRNA(Tyr) deacylase
MKAVIQRVSEASVSINNSVHASINNGYVVLLGIADDDNLDDMEWLCNKIINLRIFADENGLMNLSIKQINGEILLISQFTLFAQTKGSNRPSFINAAKPTIAIPLYEKFISLLETKFEHKIKTGIFGADMKVSLINDGPVTILIDTKNKE